MVGHWGPAERNAGFIDKWIACLRAFFFPLNREQECRFPFLSFRDHRDMRHEFRQKTIPPKCEFFCAGRGLPVRCGLEQFA